MASISSAGVRSSIIIGGGAAGMSAGVVLARTRRAVTIIDAGLQSNRKAHEAHNFFTRDGEPPANLYAVGKDQFLKYPKTEFINSTVVDVSKNEACNFVVRTNSGEVLESRTVVFAQGMKYNLPSVPGLQEIWGTKAWHCPFCHGFEAQDQRILIILSAEKIGHISGIINTMSQNIYYTANEADVPEKLRKRIAKFGGKYVAPVKSIVDKGNYLTIVTEKGEVEVDSVLAEVDHQPRDDLSEKLGVVKEGKWVKVDDWGRTNVVGVYCAGDQQTMIGQVVTAAFAGNKAGVAVHMDLSFSEADDTPLTPIVLPMPKPPQPSSGDASKPEAQAVNPSTNGAK